MSEPSKRSSKLDAAPKHFRIGPAPVADIVGVDRTGGAYSAGKIAGVSLIAYGEALGHKLWIDGETLQQVSTLANQPNKGIKSRFTHPGLSSDGLGRHLGRVLDAEIEDMKVQGVLHFQQSAHSTPEGNLAGYVMDLADEDSQAAGLSIVFDHDNPAEDAFMLAHGGREVTDEAGFTSIVGFQSPDPNNVNNYPHVRLSALIAADVVDQPAANPDGFFDRQDTPRQVEAFLDYIAGFTSDKPTPVFGVDPDRATVFLDRWLTAKGLSITTEEPEMAEETPVVDNTPETTQTAQLAEETVETPVVDNTPETTQTEFMAQLDKFVEAFGTENGTKWFREGIAFDAALAKHCDELSATVRDLTAANAELQKKLDEVSLGDDPLEVESSTETKPKRTFAEFVTNAGNN